MLRAKACLELGRELEQMAHDVTMVARQREEQGRRYQSPSPWKRAAAAWTLAEALERARGAHEAALMAQAAGEAASAEADRLDPASPPSPSSS